MGGLFETRSSFSQPFLAIPIIFVQGYIFRSFEKRLNFVSSYVGVILNLLHNNNNNNAKKWWIFGPSTNRVKNQNYIIL